MKRGTRPAIALLAATVGVVSMAAPAYGYDTVEEARDAIYATADQAVSDIEAVVADLEAAAPSMTTQAEVDDAAIQARLEILGIRQHAYATINQIKEGFPSQLAHDAAAAKQSASTARQKAIAEIGSIQATYPLAAPPPTTTTTTQSATTTSTTPSATTTSTTSTPPSTTTSSSPSTSLDTTSTVPSATATREFENDQDQRFFPFTGTNRGDGGNVEGVVPQLPAMTSMAADGSIRSSLLANLGINLPPAIEFLVGGPVDIARIIWRTAATGGASIWFPLALLALAAAVIVLFDRRRSTARLSSSFET